MLYAPGVATEIGSMGGPITLAIGIAVDAIAALFTILGFLQPDLKPIVKAIQQMDLAFTEAFDSIKRFAWAASRLALAGLLGILRILEDGIKAIVQQLRRLAAALKNLMDNVVTPILKALRKLQSIMRDIYNNWLRPIINAIQKVRRILAIFRAFGFKWAGALDARLARIEGRIIAPYLWLVRQMNGYGAWINIILTARGVFQKPLFMNSVYANLGHITNLWWVGQSGGLSGAPTLTPSTAPAILTPPEARAAFAQYAQTDTGPMADVAARAQLVFQTVQV